MFENYVGISHHQLNLSRKKVKIAIFRAIKRGQLSADPMILRVSRLRLNFESETLECSQIPRSNESHRVERMRASAMVIDQRSSN